jgi:hypothetical protein
LRARGARESVGIGIGSENACGRVECGKAVGCGFGRRRKTRISERRRGFLRQVLSEMVQQEENHMFKVIWHTEHASGELPGLHDNEVDAEKAGEDWMRDMVDAAPNETYDFEVVEVIDQQNPANWRKPMPKSVNSGLT